VTDIEASPPGAEPPERGAARSGGQPPQAGAATGGGSFPDSEADSPGRQPPRSGTGAVAAPDGASSVPAGPPPADGRLARLGLAVPAAIFIAFVVVFAAASVIQVRQAGKPVTFDLGNYEYYSGFAVLHGFRGPMALPGQWETYLDAQLNSIYYLLIAHLSPRRAVYSIAFLQSLSVSVLAVCVWRGVRASGGRAIVAALTGLVAGAGAILSPIFRVELGQTSSDVILPLLLFVAVAFLYRILSVPGTGRRPFAYAGLAGALLGLAGELKLTEAAFAVAILLGFAAALLVGRARAGWSYGRCVMLVAAVVLSAAVVAVAVYLPMGLMLWHRYHDPLFPFYNSFFHSPDLRPGNFSIGYAVNSPASFWEHFRGLLGGKNKQNGFLGIPEKSPVLFFALLVAAVMLVFDLIKRDKPTAVFIEICFVAGFVLWAVVLGFYRYLAPLEMAAGAVVIMLVALHRVPREVLFAGIACAVLLSPIYSVMPPLGTRSKFGSSYFEVSPQAFRDLSGAGVVLAAGGPLGFLTPDLPANTEIIRAGGQLELAMSRSWWRHVAYTVQHSHRRWWVVYSIVPEPPPSRTVPAALRQLGFPGSYHACHRVKNAVDNVQVCLVTPAAGSTATKLADPAKYFDAAL
jgi:hypothetical protein